MAQTLVSRMTIIGLGLIGSSIARSAHRQHLATTLVGCDYNDISLATARKQGLIDSADNNPATAVSGSQLVIIATPPKSFTAIAGLIAPHLAPGAVVMDTGSVKQAAMQAIAPFLPSTVHYVPAHPIAGSEQSGISAGRADLFERKRVIITPLEPLRDQLLHTVMGFWQAMGARVEGMPADIHDMIYAYVSHLPQLLAFAVAQPLEEEFERGEPASLQPFLRLAHSNPLLWSDIFDQNKDNLLMALDRYLDVLSHIAAELKKAPDDSPAKANPVLTRTVLFPRIAASCLITTVMEAEKNAGFPFARYAGSGFADFTSPACRPPEDDIEHISGQYQEVAGLIAEYIDVLKQYRRALV